MYEFFKHRLSHLLYDKPSSLRPVEASLCGSAAGGIAAVLTTPLDVLKTRVMLDLRVRKADLSSKIYLPASGLFSSWLPISSRPTAADISLGGNPRAIRWCHTENPVDLCGWSRVFGYVRVDNRYLGFVNPKPAVSILATVLIKRPPPPTTALVDLQFTQVLCDPRGLAEPFPVFSIVTAVPSFIDFALLEHRNHAHRGSPSGYHRDQLRLRSRGDRPPE
jgi:hypothetical protein